MSPLGRSSFVGNIKEVCQPLGVPVVTVRLWCRSIKNNKALQLYPRPSATGGKFRLWARRQLSSRADQMRQAGLAGIHPLLINAIAITHQQSGPILNEDQIYSGNRLELSSQKCS